jgi:hypothetical protein
MGTEAFAGDGAPAVAARLDSPHSVAISPGGLLTLADSDNQRIRQLDALPAPGPDIHTIAGIGSGAPGTLSLTGPGVVGGSAGVDGVERRRGELWDRRIGCGRA